MVGKCMGAPMPPPVPRQRPAQGAFSYSFGERDGYGYGYEQTGWGDGRSSGRRAYRSGGTDDFDIAGAVLLGSLF